MAFWVAGYRIVLKFVLSLLLWDYLLISMKDPSFSCYPGRMVLINFYDGGATFKFYYYP